jgi:plastocyanin
VVDCVDATTEPTVEVVQVDFDFEPPCLVVLAGQSLEIRNEGTVVHNFSVEGTSVSLDTQPGEQTSTEPIGGAVLPGTHRFFCSYHQDRGMDGDITVSAAG